MSSQSLSLFHPVIAEWFREKYGAPTDIQDQAWPVIAGGEHVLVSAPTGTGKTLTAFLWALNRLITGAWESDAVRVLYISPLKALNTDIRENLAGPLHDIRNMFISKGLEPPAVRIFTRSGDTPQRERRSMVQHPPEILITTPESLNLILSSPRARTILSGLKTVILDEIHAVAAGKRGAHMISAVERCTLLSGEFQRIALSATVHPLDRIARFAGGYRLIEETGSIRYEPRPVRILSSSAAKKIRISIEGIKREGNSEQGGDSLWRSLSEQIREIIQRNRSTLIFVNNRRHAERLAMYLNENCDIPCAYSHHGSLAKELRHEVEKKLKAGELKAIVSTSSLEMGIDVGEIDETVLVQTPPSVSSTLQRIGRAGHSVHRISRGTIIPLHGLDNLNAAVVTIMSIDRNIEEIRLVNNPLDILCQIILSMTGVDSWDVDSLYAFIGTMSPFYDMSRKQYDTVLMMLAGRYEETRIRELRPRILIDTVNNRIEAREGVLSLIYSSGGTIPDRGYYSMRIQGSSSRIGELDEEFVWERRTGDTFVLGTQRWKIANITEKEVEVVPWQGSSGMSPFWRAEVINRAFHLSDALLRFLEKWNDHDEDDAFLEELKKKHLMDDTAARSLVSFLQLQKTFTGRILPHRHHVIIEHVTDPGRAADPYTIVHTLWGNEVNYPFMLAFSAAWEQRYNNRLETFSFNDAIYLEGKIEPEDILSLVNSRELESLLRKSLERSNYFGARFRENAGRALLLPRSDAYRRMPLWVTRQRSKKLLDSVWKYPDFPLILETWRTCLKDEFDLHALKMLLDEIRDREIAISQVSTTSPSPFAGFLQWQVTNRLVYEDDTPHSGGTQPAASQELLKEAVFTSALRPEIDPAVTEELRKRLQRTAEGYSPSGVLELAEWVRERVCIPADEWDELVAAMKRDHDIILEDIQPEINSRIAVVQLPNANTHCFMSIENIPRTAEALDSVPDKLDIRSLGGGPLTGDAQALLKKAMSALHKRDGEVWSGPGSSDIESILLQWLSYYGPVLQTKITEMFGVAEPLRTSLITVFIENRNVVTDLAVKGTTEPVVCDAENLERLLRMIRKAARPSFTALPADHLQLFLADIQGLTKKEPGDGSLRKVLDRLFGYPAGAMDWETFIFPSRIANYRPFMIDSLLTNSALQWFGCGRRRISFRFAGDEDLVAESEEAPKLSITFPDRRARYSYGDLLRHSANDSETFTKELWKNVWSGAVSCDTFEAVRKGDAAKFGERAQAEQPLVPEQRVPYNRPAQSMKQGMGRWNTMMRIFPGSWYVMEQREPVEDPVYREELNKERVRILMARYGILFKELLDNELNAFRWPRLFRTLRIMELSGEVLSGHFFENIPGLQFISHAAYRRLQEKLPEDAVYMMNAADPCSLCGIQAQALRSSLPERLASTYIVFHGVKPVIIARKQGMFVECLVPPDCKDLQRYCELLKEQAFRSVKPVKPVRIEKINDESVLSSRYGAAFVSAGFVRDYKYLSYWGDS